MAWVLSKMDNFLQILQAIFSRWLGNTIFLRTMRRTWMWPSATKYHYPHSTVPYKRRAKRQASTFSEFETRQRTPPPSRESVAAILHDRIRRPRHKKVFDRF